MGQQAPSLEIHFVPRPLQGRVAQHAGPAGPDTDAKHRPRGQEGGGHRRGGWVSGQAPSPSQSRLPSLQPVDAQSAGRYSSSHAPQDQASSCDSAVWRVAARCPLQGTRNWGRSQGRWERARFSPDSRDRWLLDPSLCMSEALCLRLRQSRPRSPETPEPALPHPCSCSHQDSGESGVIEQGRKHFQRHQEIEALTAQPLPAILSLSLQSSECLI